MNLSHIARRCFVNAPFSYLAENIDRLLSLSLQPEIGLEGDVLYQCSLNDFQAIAGKLHAAGLSCTLHAPFFDLSVGALDQHIRKASRDKIRKAFDLIPIFKPKSIVCHLGFEENKHGYKEEQWFGFALEGWKELLEIAKSHHIPMMLENTYERSPKQLKRMLQALDSPFARYCLDTGHIQAFAKNRWQDWLPELEPWLGQLHLHDNNGDKDAHLPIGQGRFDFTSFSAYIAERKLSPLVTLEPHREEDLETSLLAFDRTFHISSKSTTS